MALTAQTLLAVSETVKVLVFPLVILLVGAVVSGILVPRIVNAREERRKSLELRTNLVTEITEAVMSFLMAIQFAQQAQRYADAQRRKAGGRLQHGGEEPDVAPATLAQAEAESGLADVNQAYKRWEIESAVIETKLGAYFPDTGLSGRWADFSADLVTFYGTLGVRDDVRIKALVERHPGGEDSRKGLLHGGLLATNADLIKTVLTTTPYLG